MKPRLDVTGIILGLVALLLAAFGLWEAFGTINWSLVGLIAPISLVIVGLVGLALSKPRA